MLCSSAAIAASAGSPSHRESAGACGKTAIAGTRSGLAQIAAATPVCVDRNPSDPRSPEPCRKRITGHFFDASNARGTYTEYGYRAPRTVTDRIRNPVSCGVIVRQESSAANASNGRLGSRMRMRKNTVTQPRARATPLLYNRRVTVSKREKAFNTACQEEVYRQVKSYLDELVDEHFDDAEHCDFYLKYGSTVLEISIDPYQEDDAVIEVLAFCVQGVEPSFELMSELLKVNAEVPLGAFSMVGEHVFFSHSFLGRRLHPEQLIASLDIVANVSDEYDEKLVAKYGGETAIDCLRSGGFRPPVQLAARKADSN